MNKGSSQEIKRGQAISFRVPSDTPDHILKHLQKLKETEKRNFSSKIATYVMEGVGHSFSREKEVVTIPLPKKLTKAQRDWLKHEHSEALIGSILYQLITNPVRSSSLLASLNSNSIDIEESLYLQEAEIPDFDKVAAINREESQVIKEEKDAPLDIADDDSFEDELDSFNWDEVKKEEDNQVVEEEEKEEDVEDLLGGFLAHMNK